MSLLDLFTASTASIYTIYTKWF